MGPAGDMGSHYKRVARGSIEIRNMLTARRLPRRAWQLWKTLGGADRTALKGFFETDDHYHYVRLRKYFSISGVRTLQVGKAPGSSGFRAPRGSSGKALEGRTQSPSKNSSRTMTISFIFATISSVDPLRL